MQQLDNFARCQPLLVTCDELMAVRKTGLCQAAGWPSRPVMDIRVVRNKIEPSQFVQAKTMTLDDLSTPRRPEEALQSMDMGCLKNLNRCAAPIDVPHTADLAGFCYVTVEQCTTAYS